MDLPTVWAEHQQTTFPPTALGLGIEGLPLVKLDALAGAALTASLRRDGIVRPLPDPRRAELARARDLAARALSELPLDDAARTYFERLVSLAAAVLSLPPRPS